jgi:hypothetical protein
VKEGIEKEEDRNDDLLDWNGRCFRFVFKVTVNRRPEINWVCLKKAPKQENSFKKGLETRKLVQKRPRS